MSRLIEQVATLLLFLLVLLRAPAAWRDRRARPMWFATLFGAVGLLCRGAVVNPAVLDSALGGRNWLNLVQNLSATVALWLSAQAVIGLVHDRRPRLHLVALLLTLAAIALPFALIDRGDTTGGRRFIAARIEQTPMLVYVIVYTACVGVLAVLLLVGVRRRHSVFYLPFRIGALMVTAASADEIGYATAAHWQLFREPTREVLYLAFTPLFYPGLMLLMTASLLFAAARAGQRRHALRLLDRLEPSTTRSRPAAGAELSELYEAVVRTRDATDGQDGPNGDALREAEALLSRYRASRVPSYQRPITYRPE